MQGLTQIQALYQIERTLRDATPGVRYQTRQDVAKPLLQKLQDWLTEALPPIPPQSLTGKALGYRGLSLFAISTMAASPSIITRPKIAFVPLSWDVKIGSLVTPSTARKPVLTCIA